MPRPDPEIAPEGSAEPGDSSLTLSFTQLVFSDLRAHRPDVKPSWLGVLLRLPSSPGLLASILVRAHQCLGRSGRGRIAHQLRTLGNVLIGIDLAPGITVGTGFGLMHPSGTTLGFGARIGDNVWFAGGVVLAARHYEVGAEHDQGFAVIEDDVIVGAHAVLVGNVRVGRGAMIGANSVVLSDVPAGAVVMGVPARRVGTRNPAAVIDPADPTAGLPAPPPMPSLDTPA